MQRPYRRREEFQGNKPKKIIRTYQREVQFVMKSKALADGYRKFFQFMWDHCK